MRISGEVRLVTLISNRSSQQRVTSNGRFTGLADLVLWYGQNIDAVKQGISSSLLGGERRRYNIV